MNQLLYLPLPSWTYDRLRHTYQLVIRKEEAIADDQDIDEKTPEEVVFEADTNLPIRMLFILNAIPLLKAKEQTL